jgi:rhodanese-related sulfurtransferase
MKAKKKTVVKKVKVLKEVKPKITWRETLIGSIVICAVASGVALMYTGTRVLAGVDKIATGGETQALNQPEVKVIKKIPVEAQYKYLLKNVAKKEDIPKIHIAEAKALFESGEALFIDARSESEYKQSRIPGSIYIGAGDPPSKIEEYASKLKGKVLVPYCHGAGCHLSDKVAHKLHDAGYKKVAIFFGGWPEWTQAAMPVEEYTPPAEFAHLFKEAVSGKEVVEVTLDEAKFLYDNGLGIFVDADVRERYNEKTISGSISMPFDSVKTVLPSYRGYLSQKPVIVYCHGKGGKSRKAAEELYNEGIRKVHVFINALPQWEEKGYPVIKR